MPKVKIKTQHLHEYICIGPNCWGRGEVPEDAFKQCVKNWPKYHDAMRGRRPKIYIDCHIYRCPKGSTVSEFNGNILIPPKMLKCPDCKRLKEELSPEKE